MTDKFIGALLVHAAYTAIAIDSAGSQIARAIILGGFYSGNRTGAVPLGQLEGGLHWVVIPSGILLAVLGLYFLFLSDKLKGMKRDK
jgi:hypothetical protein